MKFIITSLVIVVIVCVTNIKCKKIEAPKCCKNDKNLLVEAQCDVNSDGKNPNIDLQCTEKYILDPFQFDDDNYTITENGTLLISEMETILFADE